MLLAKKLSKQREPRIPALPVEIKGLLSDHERASDPQVPFLVWDVSASGLGILLSDRLEAGDVLRLEFGAPVQVTVVCTVVWCELQEADYDFQEPSFRVGLITTGHGKPLQCLVDCLEQALKKKA